MSRPAPIASFDRRGFTLVEVLIATVVLGLGLASSAICLQIGLSNFDNARTTTLAAEVLQDQVERLRLLNWPELEALPATATLSLPAHFADAGEDAQRLTLTRDIEDVTHFPDLKHVRFTASWTSVNGTDHSRTLHLRYAKGGVFDYYYGSSGI